SLFPGFIAARTKALIEASKEAREKGKASTRCAQDCCVTDVPLPGVTLLALSRDQSVLAACTGSEIQFFSATSLLTDKDIKPSSSCSMGRSGTVKDFKWLDNASIVLSNGGLLSHGSLGQGLKDVDAVDCSKDGNHIAVARKNSLRILTPDLKETCCMALLFQLWPDSDSEGTDIKVDSIGWVRDDSIVVGCVRLNEESNEEDYLVKVIRSGGDTFFESSSKPVVLRCDVSRGIRNDILPSGVGPNLLLGYLHRWDLLVVTNKKSTDDHISLLKWPSRTDEERTVVYLEMVEDRYSPRIDLQENDDDNVILGFGVENVSLFQKITVLVGPEQKEVAPQHLLLCLTSEGKLIIYYLARISDPSDLPQTSLSTIEDSNVDKQISPATVSNKDLTPSVTSSSAKSLLARPGTMATHDSSKAKKTRPEESCRKLLSAVLEKYNVECENYDDDLIIYSKDSDVILRIEKTLSAPPDCDKPTDYNKLIEELQTVTKRMVARKYARERDVLVKNLLLAIDKISHFESDIPFVDKQNKDAALQAKDWLLNKQREQKSVSIYEDAVLKCTALDNWIKRLELDQTTEGSLLQDSSTSSSGYEELPEGSSVEEQTNKFPPRSVPTGETLLEIFRVETNLALIKTILVYDYKGAALVYKSKQGDKSRFRRRCSNWLSKHTKKTRSDFIDSLTLTGPTRPMTADGECWVIKLDVPAESSFGVEDPELCDKLFKATLPLSSDYIDRPRCSLLSIRGGVVNISSITFSNALRCTVRFILDRRVDVSAKQFYIRGELTLSVEDYDVKFTLFRSQFPKVTARILSETKVEIPLLRDVLSLPVGARVHVGGILKLRRGKVLVDDHLILDKETVEAEWPVIPLNGVASPSHLKACLSIALCDYI
uniref:DUF6598 domain-containing protein n=1 Tax=Aegilops tauschii subsp. strangulata TaxID=200361 RepID=A0A453AKQ6_AEGTS